MRSFVSVAPAMDGNMETKMNSKSKVVLWAAFAVALLAVPISSYAAQQEQAKQAGARRPQHTIPIKGSRLVRSIFSKVVDLSTRAQPRTSRTISRLITGPDPLLTRVGALAIQLIHYIQDVIADLKHLLGRRARQNLPARLAEPNA